MIQQEDVKHSIQKSSIFAFWQEDQTKQIWFLYSETQLTGFALFFFFYR